MMSYLSLYKGHKARKKDLQISRSCTVTSILLAKFRRLIFRYNTRLLTYIEDDDDNYFY